MTVAIVVGAGVFGLSIARELAGRGWSVRLIDQHKPGTAGPSSARLRIVRYAHGADTWYPASAWRARSDWLALSAECGRSLFVQCGVLIFAGADPSLERAGLHALESLRIPVERIEPGQIGERFTGFTAGAADFIVYEPAAGVLRARQAMLALATSAGERGVRFDRATAEPAAGQVVLGGRRQPADLVVWAPGTRLPELFPGICSAVEVPETIVDLAGTDVRSGVGEPEIEPAWLDRERDVYCLPGVDGFGHRIGPVPEPADTRWRVGVACRRPDLAELPVRRVDPCSYTAMPDGDFLLAPLPGSSDVWLVGGDSGHGFKHGPAWASYACDVMQGDVAALPRFGLR